VLWHESATNRLGSVPGQAPANKGRKFPAEPLTPAEADALIAACSAASRTGIRNRALLTVMYRGGLRIAEVLALKVSDIDPARGTIRVLHGKGNRARTVGLDSGAMAVVQRWIDARKAAGIRNGTLFCTLQGGKVSDKYVRALLGRLAAAVGIEKRVHPHGFRHTHAVELVAEGVPVNVISRQLGHANSSVTARYLDHVAPADVVAAMQRRTWQEPHEHGRPSR
jgi:site-specific recombinase XerD